VLLLLLLVVVAQIVANPFNGIDVDRADYLRRDARNTAHHAEWNFDQLKAGCQVGPAGRGVCTP
jgi:HD superfamily phosphohydrolase